MRRNRGCTPCQLVKASISKQIAVVRAYKLVSLPSFMSNRSQLFRTPNKRSPLQTGWHRPHQYPHAGEQHAATECSLTSVIKVFAGKTSEMSRACWASRAVSFLLISSISLARDGPCIRRRQRQHCCDIALSLSLDIRWNPHRRRGVCVCKPYRQTQSANLTFCHFRHAFDSIETLQLFRLDCLPKLKLPPRWEGG